jgi:TRAP-type C4-dicarboxylate transport system permease small subunit
MKIFWWGIKNIEEIISSFSLSGMIFVASVNIFARYFFGWTFGGGDELALILFTWATFVGAAAAYKRNLHYGMEFLLNQLPRSLKMLLRRLLTLTMIVLCGYLTYISFRFTINTQKTTLFMHLPYSCINISAVAGFMSCTVYSGVYFIQSIIFPKDFAARYDTSDADLSL